MATRAQRTADKALNKLHAQILGELVRQPANRLCADCKKKDPRWASWNLGVFICIRCSGIHRSLGTHISKVKSIDLDCWTQEQVASMERWGNARANRYWEGNLRSGQHPTEYGIETWIRSKYERKAFAIKGPIPAPEELDEKEEREAASAPEKDGSAAKVQNEKQIAPTGNVAASTAAKPDSNLLDLIGGPSESNQAGDNSNNMDDLFSPFTSAPTTGSPSQQQQQRQQVPSNTSSLNSVNQPQPQLAGIDLFGISAQTTTTSQQSGSTSIGQISAQPAPSATGLARPPGQPDLSQPNQDLKSYILSLYSQPSGGNTGTGGGRSGFGGF